MMSDEEKPKTSLILHTPAQLSVRASLVTRGLQDIFENDSFDMYSWLDCLPPGSTLLSLSFQDGSELPNDDRDTGLWSKRSSEMSIDETLRSFMEERSTGFLNLNLFEKDMHTIAYSYRGYIEVEGVHPFERAVHLVGVDEKEILMCAVGILVRRLLVGQRSICIYCDGDTLLRFLADDLKSVEDLIAQVNSMLRVTIVKIRKLDGTIVKLRSGLRLELSEYHRR
ncbi:MAG TPA: hypothetical protein VGN44_00855 [Candidatus Angelobacter sp.]|jgi:hypothetical protein